MKRAIIFYNGDLSDVRRAKEYITSGDFIICADGGASYVEQLHLVPDVIIGDFDSLSKNLQKKFKQKNIEWISFQKEKDQTDSELALTFTIEKGYKHIIIFGLLGSRLDHLITNILTLSRLEQKGVKITLIEGNQEIRVTRSKMQIEGTIGDLVSLIPLQGDVKNIHTKGLQYVLNDETLVFGYSRGVSNVLTEKKSTISIKNGLLLVVHTKVN